MRIDVTKFFDLDEANWRYGFDEDIYYNVLLVSKVTGEVIALTFDGAHFDELLTQMDENVNFLEDELTFVKEHKGWLI